MAIVSSYEATKRLGWISTVSRKVLLARYLLRTIGDIVDLIDHESTRHSVLLRALGTSLIALDLDKSARSQSGAPYYPKNRPVNYALKAKHLKAFSFELHTGPTPEISVIFDADTKKEIVNHAQIAPGSSYELLSHEIEVISRGTNLSSKKVTAERARRLSTEPLWETREALFANRLTRFRRTSKTRLALLRANSETSGSFDFWIKYYDSLVKGEQLDSGLIERVAAISPTIWLNGHEAVADEIARIQADLLSKKLPQAELVEVNPDTGSFRVVPIALKNPTLLQALFANITDALEDAINSSNGLSESSSESRKITRATTRYGNNPQQAELTLTAVAKGLRRQIHETKYLPDSEDNLALLDTIEEGVRGIRANHADVAANREQLARQAFGELRDVDKNLLEEARPILTDISEGHLADDFAKDIPSLVNDSLLPIPEGAPPLPAADVATRIFSRVSKIVLLIDKAAEFHDSKGNKTVRLAMQGVGVSGILYAVVQLGLKLLGVL